MYRVATVIACAAMLAGCQTTQQQQQPSMVWVRMDGTPATNAAAARKFEVDRTICLGEVQKVAAGMPLIYYQGLIGALQAASIQHQNQQVMLDIAKGCMAQRGYMLVPRKTAG